MHDWIATICLPRNCPDLLPVPESRRIVALLAELQDRTRNEVLFREERRLDPELDARFDEAHY